MKSFHALSGFALAVSLWAGVASAGFVTQNVQGGGWVEKAAEIGGPRASGRKVAPTLTSDAVRALEKSPPALNGTLTLENLAGGIPINLNQNPILQNYSASLMSNLQPDNRPHHPFDANDASDTIYVEQGGEKELQPLTISRSAHELQKKHREEIDILNCSAYRKGSVGSICYDLEGR